MASLAFSRENNRNEEEEEEEEEEGKQKRGGGGGGKRGKKKDSLLSLTILIDFFQIAVYLTLFVFNKVLKTVSLLWFYC